MTTTQPQATTLLLLATLAVGGCTQKTTEDKPADAKTVDAKSDGKTADASETKADAKAEDSKEAEAEPKADLEAIPEEEKSHAVAVVMEHEVLEHAGAIGHVMFAQPENFINELKAQAVPESMGMLVSPQMARMSAKSALGEYGGIADHLALDKPIGCMLADVDLTKYPVACVMGYEGGAAGLVADLGDDGKKDDAMGHAGHYEMGGQELFIDEMGEYVVLTNHTDLLAKTKNYLQKNMLDRAEDIDLDIEAVGYPAAGIKRYEAELKPVFEAMSASSDSLPSDNPMSEVFKEYTELSNEEAIKTYKNTEEMLLGMGLDEKGLLGRFEMFPVEGSDLQARMKKTVAGPYDFAHATKLPAASWLVVGGRQNAQYGEDPTLKALLGTVVKAYATATENDEAKTKAAIEAYLQHTKETYEPENSFAIAHLPDTPGGFVVEMVLLEGKSGTEGWKSRSEGFTPEAILGAEAAKMVTWEFADGGEHEGVKIDRWTIKPTEEGRKKMLEADDMDKVEKVLGSFDLVIERFETDGMAGFTMSMTDASPYTKAAIDALKGKAAIGDDAAFKAFAEHNKGVTSMMVVDVQKASDWFRAIVPDNADEIPKDLGVDLTDMTMAAAVSEKDGSSTIEMRASQAFLDKLRALFN